MCLPKKIRPNPAILAVLVFGGIGYIGMLLYSVLAYGVADLG